MQRKWVWSCIFTFILMGVGLMLPLFFSRPSGMSLEDTESNIIYSTNVGRPLRVRCNSGGFGNRIGWWLQAATVGQVLKRPVFTFWNLASEGQAAGTAHGGYSFEEIQRMMTFPSSLQMAANSDSKCLLYQPNPAEQSCNVEWDNLTVDEIPFHCAPYVNDYTPQLAFRMWTDYSKSGVGCSNCPAWRFPCGNSNSFSAIWPPNTISMRKYLEAFDIVASQVKPKINLCLPAERSYLVLHLRRGDRGSASTTQVFESMLHITQEVGLPWMVISDDQKLALEVEQLGSQKGVLFVRASCSPKQLVKDQATTHSAELNTARLIQDFFALTNAAGIVVSAPGGESSLSTVASLLGHTPIFFPEVASPGILFKIFPHRRANVLVKWQLNNDGEPLRDIFLSDKQREFISALKGHLQIEILKAMRPCVRCKEPKRIGEASDGGYVMCNELLQSRQITGAYSFGINGIDGWGETISNIFKVPVYEFDCFHTTAPKCSATSNYCDLRFTPKCVAAAVSHRADKERWTTFKDILELNGHYGATTDPSLIMKMDIECFEWAILADNMSSNALSNFAHIVLELHDIIPWGRLAEKLLGKKALSVQHAAMKNLLSNFAVVHIHGNMGGGKGSFVDPRSGPTHGAVYTVPNLVEITFTNRRLLKDGGYKEHCLTHVSPSLEDEDAGLPLTFNFPVG